MREHKISTQWVVEMEQITKNRNEEVEHSRERRRERGGWDGEHKISTQWVVKMEQITKNRNEEVEHKERYYNYKHYSKF